MLPDPLNPQRLDLFHDGTEIRRIIYVGERWVFSENLAGDDERPNLRAAVATWTPVLPPSIVSEDTMLHEYHMRQGEYGLWTNPAVASATGRAIVLHPDGTWEEESGS